MRTMLMRVALFVTSASIPVVVGSPTRAWSAMRTVSGAGACQGAVGCQIRIPAGTDFPISGLQGAFFDFVSGGTRSITLSLVKESYTGSMYTDYLRSSQAGTVDVYISANTVLLNSSVYDYLYAQLAGDDLKRAIGVGVLK